MLKELWIPWPRWKSDSMENKTPESYFDVGNMVWAINYASWPTDNCAMCGEPPLIYQDANYIHYTGLCESCYEVKADLEKRMRDEYEQERRSDGMGKYK